MRYFIVTVPLLVAVAALAQQIDFYIRSPEQSPKNRPNREVFMHFFGMEVTWR